MSDSFWESVESAPEGTKAVQENVGTVYSKISKQFKDIHTQNRTSQAGIVKRAKKSKPVTAEDKLDTIPSRKAPALEETQVLIGAKAQRHPRLPQSLSKIFEESRLEHHNHEKKLRSMTKEQEKFRKEDEFQYQKYFLLI